MSNELITSGLEALSASQAFYKTADDFYEGTAPEIYASTLIAQALKGSGSKFRVNWAKTAVDAVLNRLEINAITAEDTSQQEAIERLWKSNRLGLHARQVHKSALTHGDHYLIVEDAGDGDIRIASNSSRHVRIFYSLESPDVATYAIKSWVDELDRIRVTLYFPDRTERWISTSENVKNVATADFTPYVEGNEEWPAPNPLGRIPVFQMVTEFPQGKPEHYECYGPQNMLNKLVITQAAVIDHSAWPQRYAITEEGTKQGQHVRPEDVFAENGDDAPEFEQALRNSPGTMQKIAGAKAVGQFQAADPKTFIDAINEYVLAMAQVSETPTYLFQPGSTPPSGESRKIADQPLVRKAEQRQMTFGHCWEEVFSYALNLLGFETVELHTTWNEAGFVDDLDGWSLVEKKVALGIPRRQALLEMGYTAAQLDSFGITEEKSDLAGVTTPITE